MFKKILKFLVSIRLYKWGIILWGESDYKIKGSLQRYIIDNILPGDVLLRRIDSYISSRLVPGFWSHCGIYVGINHVIHIDDRGIVKEDILDFMRCDHIALYRFNRDKTKITNAINKSYEYLSQRIQYDYTFSKSNNEFYCSEFVNTCYDKIINSTYVLPDDIMECGMFDKIIEICSNV